MVSSIVISVGNTLIHVVKDNILETKAKVETTRISAGLNKPGEVGNFFALFSMKSPNFCQKAKF
jgi:hypothetical protein